MSDSEFDDSIDMSGYEYNTLPSILETRSLQAEPRLQDRIGESDDEAGASLFRDHSSSVSLENKDMERLNNLLDSTDEEFGLAGTRPDVFKDVQSSDSENNPIEAQAINRLSREIQEIRTLIAEKDKLFREKEQALKQEIQQIRALVEKQDHKTMDSECRTHGYGGNTREIYPNGDVVYRYTRKEGDPDSVVLCRVDSKSGSRTYVYPNGQVERYFRGGPSSKDVLHHEIVHVDGTLHHRFTNGREVIKYPDGTVVTIEANGQRTVVRG